MQNNSRTALTIPGYEDVGHHCGHILLLLDTKTVLGTGNGTVTVRWWEVKHIGLTSWIKHSRQH